MRLKTVLRTDVAAIVEPAARFWVGMLHRHPVAMPIVDAVFYVALVSLAWIFVGSTAGIAALVITLALYGFGVARALRRRRSQGD